MSCGNCEKPAGPDALRVYQGETCVTEICEACQVDVTVLKIVLNREAAADAWKFEGVRPVQR